jgi:hypothetical protein
MVALLILIRESLSKNDQPMLLDISHCVAHSKRDRGFAFDYIESFLAEFIEIVNKGGTLKVNVLLPIDGVIKELSGALNDLGITVANEKLLLSQSNHIEQLLREILNGVEVKVTNKNVANCSFEVLRTQQGELFTFAAYFIGLERAPVVQLRANVAMAFPVLS